jgi:hypothetical protein
MGIQEEIEVVIRLPDHISGPPVGWRSVTKRVAMLRAIMDGHMVELHFWEGKASYKDQWKNLFAARWREARAVVPMIYVQERMATPQ